MPLHDWTRSTDAAFHNFHLGWLWNLASAMNTSVLPTGYVARTEEYVGPYQADVVALETGQGTTPDSRGTGAALVPTLVIDAPRILAHKEHRIAVYSARDERRVAVIEVGSPGNKDSQVRADWFARKLLDYIESGLHLTILDLLPPTKLVPDGFASPLANSLGATASLPPITRQAASFECEATPPRYKVYSVELVVERPLPDAPVFLEPGLHVALPLEATYCETVSGLPAPDRARIGA